MFIFSTLHQIRLQQLERAIIFLQSYIQGILKGEVSLCCWPPVWLVWNQLYDNWQFLFYLQNRLIQTGQTGGQQYSDASPFSIPWWGHRVIFYTQELQPEHYKLGPFVNTPQEHVIYLQNRLIQIGQTGGQQYSYASPFSIPWYI